MNSIKLKFPLTDTDGEVIEELHFRRPTVKDLKAMDKVNGEIEKVAILAQRIATSGKGSQIGEPLFDKIDAEDFSKMGDIVGSFLEGSPQIGGK